MVASVSVRPALLRWARERALMSPQDLAEKMRVPASKVLEWEETGSLSLPRLEKLANRTRTPLGYLFLEKPPDDSLPIADFRTLADVDEQKASPDLLETIHICQRRQAWFREFALFDEEAPLPFVGQWTISGGHDRLASEMRKALCWDSQARSGLSNWEDALRELADRIEAMGVLVMRSGIVGSNTRRKLNVKEFRGFALADDLAPLVFVNAADARSAQMFTLVHELAHVWLGESGVSDVAVRSANESERFCNRVSAEVLVPMREFTEHWQQTDNAYDEARRVAKHFKVSTHVILIRALEAEIVSLEHFRALYKHAQEQTRKTKSPGGDFYRTQGARLGRRFTSAVVYSALEGRTTYSEAFRLLGVKSSNTFDLSLIHI